MRPHIFPLVVISFCLAACFSTRTFSQNRFSDPEEEAAANQSKRKGFCKTTPEEKARTGVLNASLLGTSGLFSVIDAETLYCKTYLLSPGFETFGLSGRVRISQFHFTGAYGLTDRLEVFARTSPIQHAQIGAPNQLSGFLLGGALQRANLPPGTQSQLVNNTNGFFPLAGLDVSGALVGGALPGLPVGASRQINDPVLMRSKLAFETPAFLNDFPFLGRGGSTYGDALTIGAKYRFSVVDEKKRASKFFSSSVLGYITVPSHLKNDFFNAASDLFQGARPGVDFGVFLVGSFYLPVAPKKDVSKAPKDPSYFETLNHHVNLGFVRNSDPSSGGVRLVDRRDAFVVGYGLDTVINRYLQALGELKYQRFVGGGTANLIKRDPVDINFGVRIYPTGLPQLRKVREGKVRNTDFFSIGVAYRLSLNSPTDFGSIGSSRHNLVLQLAFGKTRLFGGLGRDCPKVLPCDDAGRAVLSEITIDNTRVRRGEIVTVVPRYVRGEFSRRDVSLYVDGKLTTNENLDEDGDPVNSAIKFKVNLPPRQQAYKVRLVVQTKYEKTVLGRPECPQAGVTCDPSESGADLFVVNTPPALVLEPAKIGPVSAQRAQTLSLNAKSQDADRDPLTLSWIAPPGISLGGVDGDSVRSFSTAGLEAGKHYQVTATVSDGADRVTQSAEIIVNNPPTVDLRADHPNLLGVAPGDPIKLTATGKDLDNDALSYSWQLSGTTTEGRSLSQNLTNDSQGNPVFDFSTQDLEPGKYAISVMASDSIDTSSSSQVNFEVVRRPRQIYFEFDRYRLLKTERAKLDEEAVWLSADQNRTIEIRCEGNADRVGKPAYNTRLGCKRACSAKAYLTTKGISADRIIIAVSFGERKADQTRQQGADRRVDLTYSRRPGAVAVVPDGAEGCNCRAIIGRPKKTLRRQRQ